MHYGKQRACLGDGLFLKRLRLHGFKSFASATELEFGPGITAIVGPNGSGKSNVVDALRWVLGEQNPRVLRMRRFEDLIFAGTARRAAQGMAEVTAVFDNSDGSFPLPHAEVALTRRAYRSGEGEVLVNRSPARLRDLQELLLGSGLGHHSYLFVPQGMAEAFLSWRPDERRALIEDAAGVRQVRVLLAEAQERHRLALVNMERIDLILSEVAPQVRQGERLAKRAQEREDVERRLAEALKSWYGRLWHEAQAAIEAASLTAAESRQAEERLQAALQSAEAGRTAHQNKLRGLEEHRRHLAQTLAELRDKERSATSSVEREEERATTAARDQAMWRSQQAALAAERVTQNAELARVTEQRDAAEAALRALTGVSVRDEKIGAEIESLELRLQEQQREYDQVARQIARNEVALEHTIPQRRRLDQEMAVRAEERGRLALPLLRVHRESEAASYQRKRDAAELAQAYIARDDVAYKVLQARTKLTRAEQALRATQAAVATAKAERVALEGSLPARPTADERARLAVLIGVEADTLPSLIEAIEVPVGLEAAIAAALDSALYALLVPPRLDLVETAEVLGEQVPGRMLLPLDARATQRPTVVSAWGALGFAADLVTCASAHRGALEALLGSVLVIDDWPIANGWLKSYPGIVVTRGGDRRYPTGALALGREIETASPLQNQRALQEIQASLKTMEEKLEVAASEQRLAEASLQDAQAALARAEDTLSQLQRQLRTSEAAEQEARRRKLSLVEQAATLRSRRKEGSEAYKTLIADQVRLQPLLATDRAQLELLQKALSSVREELESLRALEAERAAVETNRRLERSHTEDALSAAEREMANLTRTVARLEEQRKALEQRLADAQTIEERSRLGAATFLVESAEAQRQAGVLAADLQGLDKELSAFSDENAVKEAERAALQKGLPDVARQRAQAEGEVERHKQEILRLEADIAAEGIQLPLPSSVNGDAEAERKLVERLRQQWRAIAAVDQEELAAYTAVRSRWEELSAQREDLRQTEEQWREAAALLERMLQEQFSETLGAVNAAFERQFQRLFGGGSALLSLGEGEDGAGIEVILQPPGKRTQSLTALSGGERALAAAALLLALLSVHPTPFVVLDEVDAALDQANIARFLEALQELAQHTQVLLITHQPASMEAAERLYGIVQQEQGVVQALSLRLDGTNHTSVPTAVLSTHH